MPRWCSWPSWLRSTGQPDPHLPARSRAAWIARTDSSAIILTLPRLTVPATIAQPPSRSLARALLGERALLDDITLHPAHHELGRLRLAAQDTAGALSEFAQAVRLAPTDAAYLYDFGMLLIGSGQADSGATVLRHGIAEEPFYAAPHCALGIVYEQAGLRTEAARHFARFLALAPRTRALAIAAARTHLAKLK